MNAVWLEVLVAGGARYLAEAMRAATDTDGNAIIQLRTHEGLIAPLGAGEIQQVRAVSGSPEDLGFTSAGPVRAVNDAAPTEPPPFEGADESGNGQVDAQDPAVQ